MNSERVKELVQQATKLIKFRIDPNTYKHIDDPAGDFERSELDEEKFAELIIKECVRVAKDPEWFSESPSNGWRNPINHVCDVMKEHFGVTK